MITIPHIQGVISAKDQKKIPKTFVAKHSTGNDWIYFETTKEYEDYKELYFPKPTDEEEIL